MPDNAVEQFTMKIVDTRDGIEHFTVNPTVDMIKLFGFEQYTLNVSTIPALADGPNWFGVDGGEVRWIPGLMYNDAKFVRYRIWDGTKWQTS